jgi:hypothetical protein
MKKVLFLMVSGLILVLVLTGCIEIAKFSSPATVNTDGDLYKCIDCEGPESATGWGSPIKTQGNWFMYNKYPDGVYGYSEGGMIHYRIHVGSTKHGLKDVGVYWVESLGDGWYRVRYGIDSAFTVVEEHLAIQDDWKDFTGHPGTDDNQDFDHPGFEVEKFYDADGKFFIFAHFALECSITP